VAGRPLSPPVFAVALFALILLQLGGDLGRQVEDVVSRWMTTPLISWL
jgi:hypothetical protein